MDNFISGIHNYCDRWCERCVYTDRCRVFAMEKEDRQVAANDPKWETSLEPIAKTLQEAIKLLDKMAREKGIDLTKTDPEFEKERAEQKTAVEKHPLTQKSMAYLDLSRQWLEQGLVKICMDKIFEEVELGIRTMQEGEREILLLRESLEVIRWYHHFIVVKSHRALMGKEGGYDKQLPEKERGYNGTAKITRIAIERSLRAWATLLGFFEEEESALFRIMAALQQVQAQLEQTFPDMDLFARPGFDQ
ncbi:hypothetical protein [Cyclobacterium roseum]|uniref:hypothetical protein n=1 Tax=Cyclobacterium roseum TaxID=2666137 RepID=UPI001391125C|nr:hypothetical protein [Cyclobacterium roseum]